MSSSSSSMSSSSSSSISSSSSSSISSSSSKSSSSSISSSSSKSSSSSISSSSSKSSSSSISSSSAFSAPTPEKFPTVSDNSISARNKSLYQDTSYVDLFKIRFDASSLGDAQGSKLKSFVREKFSIESKNSGIYLLGTFFDRNNNSYDIIDYLISNKQLIEIYQYFKSIIGIGIRTEIADMNYLLSSSYSYVVSYINGWYVVKVKSNNYNKKESSINYYDDTLPSHNKYNSIHLGSSLISTRLYYDLYYTVNDFVSQTVLPKEYKNSIGGYLSDFSIFSVSKNIKSIYTDSIDLYLELNDYYKNLPVGSSTEILINDEIMAIELNKINIYDNSIRFVIKSRGLYKTPIQAHYVNSIVKSIDDIDFFNSNFNSDGDYLYQYRCFALQIKANAGNFMCTNLKSYFDWNSSVNSTFDFGFEVPLIDRFIISGLKGTTSRISVNDNLLNMAQQQMNGKVFNYNSFINMPVLIKSEDGFVHKRYITGYLEKQNQIELDSPLPFSISPGLEITFGPSKSRVAERGILLAESQDGLFSGFLGALSGLIGSNQNIVYNINEVISNRRSEIVKPGDTFYIWIKKIVKNNSISDLRQRLKFNFDCEVM